MESTIERGGNIPVRVLDRGLQLADQPPILALTILSGVLRLQSHQLMLGREILRGTRTPVPPDVGERF